MGHSVLLLGSGLGKLSRHEKYDRTGSGHSGQQLPHFKNNCTTNIDDTHRNQRGLRVKKTGGLLSNKLSSIILRAGIHPLGFSLLSGKIWISNTQCMTPGA